MVLMDFGNVTVALGVADAIRLLGEKAARTAYHAGAASKQCHSAGGKTAGILTIAVESTR
jgi:hypothetical protein